MSTTTITPILPHPRFIVDENGNQTDVILDIETYRNLSRIIEDMIDNRLIDETLGEETFPLDKVLREEDLRRGL